MELSQAKKASPIMVLQILKDYSDEDHPLTQQEIIDKIYEKYGVELERKSIGSTIRLLNELDFEIATTGRGSYLARRDFEKSEITYLIDGIFSSRFIPATQAEDLSNRLMNTLSIYDRKSFEFVKSTPKLSKAPNKEIFYTIETIGEARRKHKQISFCYYVYDRQGNQITKWDSYRYRVSPYYLINNAGNYYLLCRSKGKENLSVYRLDHITKVEILEDYEIEDITSIPGLENFNIIEYVNEHVYVYNGDVLDATLEIKDEDSIHCVYDWFGNNAKIFNENDKIYAKVRCNEQSLMYWCLQYCECVKAIKPESFVKHVQEVLKGALDAYNAS